MKGFVHKAYNLRRGRQYQVFAEDRALLVVPKHIDDVPQDSAEVERLLGKAFYVEDPQFTVLQTRRRTDTRRPWYRVELSDGRTGWVNCNALLGLSVTRIKRSA